MRTLLVYYSLEGNTEYAAERIAAATGADLLRLVPRKAYADKGFAKFFWGGKSAVMAEKPDLEPYTVDIAAYDRIIIGFPVWASTFTPPIRTFLSRHKEELARRKVAVFACQSGKGAEKAFAKLRQYSGIASFEAEAVFIDPKNRQAEKTDQAIDRFAETLKNKQ